MCLVCLLASRGSRPRRTERCEEGGIAISGDSNGGSRDVSPNCAHYGRLLNNYN